MKWLFSSLFLTSMFAGAVVVKAPVPESIDKPFREFTEDFVNKSGGKITMKEIATTSIKFKKLQYTEEKGGIIGVCYYTFGGPTRIEIDPIFWQKAPESERWSLIYHELGHCVCNLDHSRFVDSWLINTFNGWGIKTVHGESPYMLDGCEKSLMHPYNVSDRCIQIHKSYYIRELFQTCQPKLWQVVTTHGRAPMCVRGTPDPIDKP